MGMVLILQKEDDRTKKRCVKGTDSDEGWTHTHMLVSKQVKWEQGNFFLSSLDINKLKRNPLRNHLKM